MCSLSTAIGKVDCCQEGHVIKGSFREEVMIDHDWRMRRKVKRNGQAFSQRTTETDT